MRSLAEAQRGDIVQWGGGAGGNLHTAIITAGGSTPQTVQVIDSNWGNQKQVHRGSLSSRTLQGSVYRIWRVGAAGPGDVGAAGAGYEVAFQANTGSLWSVGSDTHGDWSQGMMAGTSPAITALSGGGYEMAFQANTGNLITIGSAGNKNWALGMHAGTSPAITALPGGGFEVAFQANTGSLWSVGSDNKDAWNLGMMSNTSPGIES